MLFRSPMVRRIVREAAAAAGRDPEQVTISAMLTCSVADDREEARDAMRRYIAVPQRARMPRYARVRAEQGFGDDWAAIVDGIATGDPDRAAAAVSDRYLDAFYVTGTPAECRQRLRAFSDAGLDLPILGHARGGAHAWKVLEELSPAAMAADSR